MPLHFWVIIHQKGQFRPQNMTYFLLSLVLWWENMPFLVLTHKAETHLWLVFSIAWCYQPYSMRHRQHPNLKMDVDDILKLIWHLALHDVTSYHLHMILLSIFHGLKGVVDVRWYLSIRVEGDSFDIHEHTLWLLNGSQSLHCKTQLHYVLLSMCQIKNSILCFFVVKLHHYPCCYEKLFNHA